MRERDTQVPGTLPAARFPGAADGEPQEAPGGVHRLNGCRSAAE